MAYNPYFPVTYQQPVYQPQQILQPQIQPQTSIIWVSGDREAQMYPVAPNNAVTLWNQSAPVVYLKQADATGKPTLKTYDLVERAQNASGATSATEDKAPAFATKDDLSAVTGLIKGFDGDLSALRADIDSIKADVYGLAGKRKKKAEADDDS